MRKQVQALPTEDGVAELVPVKRVQEASVHCRVVGEVVVVEEAVLLLGTHPERDLSGSGPEHLVDQGTLVERPRCIAAESERDLASERHGT